MSYDGGGETVDPGDSPTPVAIERLGSSRRLVVRRDVLDGEQCRTGASPAGVEEGLSPETRMPHPLSVAAREVAGA